MAQVIVEQDVDLLISNAGEAFFELGSKVSVDSYKKIFNVGTGRVLKYGAYV